MSPSSEFIALQALQKPKENSVCGDMWLCRRLGIVQVFNSHQYRRGKSKHARLNSFHLYHWEKPSLSARPCDWRDNDSNGYSSDPACGKTGGERWEYIGNIFDILPYELLAIRALTPDGVMKEE